jgi:hypothetical protein
MKSHFAIACVVACTSVQAASAGIIYQTDFSNFSLGGVNSQNGWSTYDPTFTTGGGTFATIVDNAPAGGSASGNAMKFDSGTGATQSPRYAWSPSFGTQFAADAAAGNNVLVAQTSMYMASGSTSTARQGMVAYDNSGAKILTGFYVQANTGLVYLLANYNNAGTIGNYAFNLGTGAVLSRNTWYRFAVTFDITTGRAQAGYSTDGGANYNLWFVDGAAAGTLVDEFDLIGSANSGTAAQGQTIGYYDNINVIATPAPGALALLAVAGLMGSRRRRS